MTRVAADGSRPDAWNSIPNRRHRPASIRLVRATNVTPSTATTRERLSAPGSAAGSAVLTSRRITYAP